MSSNNTLRRWLVPVLGAGMLAIGVPAALAAGGGDAASGSGSAPAAMDRFVQDEQPSTPDRGDCPEHDGSGSQGSQDSGESTAL